MLEWFVLRTHFQQEQRAQRELNRQSIETFLPLARVEQRHKKTGLLTAKIKPLFTSYLFVSLEWLYRYPVLSTIGVNTFVGYHGNDQKPQTLTQSDIDEMRNRLNEYSENSVINVSRPRDIAPGDLVQILFGPYRDRLAPVKALSGTRVEVLLQFAGVLLPVKLPKDCLVAAA